VPRFSALQRSSRRTFQPNPLLATADGTVADISMRPSLSNYSNYLVTTKTPRAAWW
jgi:hypothetical protein